MPCERPLVLGQSKASRIVWPLLAAILLATPGCKRTSGNTYVARVGNATLTRETINAMQGDSTLNPQVFINNWIISELLFQESERTGIAGSEDVLRGTEEARRRLAVAALLQQIIYSDTSGVTDQAVEEFYQKNGPAFVLREDVASLSYALFAERDAANAFRSRVISGSGWSDALAKLQEDTTGHGGLLRTASHQYFTRGRLYQPELWKLATTLPRNEISFVVKTDNGFCVLTVHGIQRQGQVPELAYVRNEVRDRLLIELRRQRYDRLIDDLRAKATVDIHGIPSATE